ncbi:hypothetical protein LTR28_006742 [Elasticomyces elasticus]|nr:hypothetical protein LTR28_006742 [Elasticomyces elasticus]
MAASPPPPPNPDTDAGLSQGICSVETTAASDLPLTLTSENWDLFSVSPLGALHMLIDAVQALATATGDVPPTPPVSRPVTPASLTSSSSDPSKENAGHRRRSSSPTSPSSPTAARPYPTIPIGSPEATHHEQTLPTAPLTDIGARAEPQSLQTLTIARRFFLKTAPSFTLSEYLLRLHHWCPHSSGVYLAAACYLHTLCVVDRLVPATNRTIHRLSLAAIRIASKAWEDNKWPQDRIAKVGGVSKRELRSLEVHLCFLLDFELFVDAGIMRQKMWALQQAARQGMGVKARLREGFKMKMPLRQAGVTAEG